MWGSGRYVSITVMNTANGRVVDTWLYRSSSGADTASIMKKLYISGKQFFFLGISATTDPIFWGK